MSSQEIAKRDLEKCKTLSKCKKIQESLTTQYLVFSDGSSIPCGYFPSMDEAIEYIDDCISYDRYLYEKYEDECIICDYWIVSSEQKLKAYVKERED